MSHPVSTREVYQGDQLLLPELRLVGRVRDPRARVPGVSEHVHPDAFELFYFERGRADWWVNGETHRLGAGDVYLTRPGERHGSVGSRLHPCGYCMVEVAFPLSGMSGPESAALGADLAALPTRRFPGPASLQENFEGLLHEHRPERGEHPAAAARAHLHLLLTGVLRAHAAAHRTEHAAGPSFAIAKILRVIEADPGRPPSVGELARTAGLSVSRFQERFVAEVGFTPAAYLRRRRIERAKVLLRAGRRSASEVAVELGFCSSQHFATVFKRYEGVGPSEFARTS